MPAPASPRRAERLLTATAVAVLLGGLVVVGTHEPAAGPGSEALLPPPAQPTATAPGPSSTPAARPSVLVPSPLPSRRAPQPVTRSTARPAITALPVLPQLPRAALPPEPAPVATRPPAPPPDPRLSWAPPALSHPVTRTIRQGERTLLLDADKDYVLRLPSRPLLVDGDFQIVGGRNVVLIGGEVRNRVGGRHLFIRGTSGSSRHRTVHLEGVRFTAEPGVTMTEGIDIDAQDEPYLTVRLQNVDVSDVHGSYEGLHADIIQNWNGPYALQLDRFHGSTEYQGVMHQASENGYPGTYGTYAFRRTWFEGPRSGSMMWFHVKDGQPPPVIDRFFITPNPDRLYPSQVLYGLEDRAAEFLRLVPGRVPPLPILTGGPGVGYRSPGYAPGGQP